MIHVRFLLLFVSDMHARFDRIVSTIVSYPFRNMPWKPKNEETRYVRRWGKC